MIGDTNAIYISSHDLISRIVQCDFDGDKLLVTNNPTLVSIAERNMNGIVPLFYNMRKAAAEEISVSSLFKGLLLAYNGGNIGTPSNNITKIWNSGKMNNEKMQAVKWLVAEVNYTIDYAKTLYKPQRPEKVDKIIKQYTKSKIPYFFMYAKGKKKEQVKPLSLCTVDRVKMLCPKRKINFNFTNSNIGKFDYKVLMNNPDIEFNQNIADKYKEISSTLNFKHTDDSKMNNYLAVFDDAKSKLFSLPYSKNVIIDNIIIDLFHNRRTALKKTFWFLFGDEVYNNIKRNIGSNFVQCERCHKRFYKHSSNEKYCDMCKGYQKIKTKTLICCDCGKEFVVDARVSNKVRCDECQRIKDKERKRIWKQNSKK